MQYSILKTQDSSPVHLSLVHRTPLENLVSCLWDSAGESCPQDSFGESFTLVRKKAAPVFRNSLSIVIACLVYLQVEQVQLDPQLQFSQVQLGLPHFTF